LLGKEPPKSYRPNIISDMILRLFRKLRVPDMSVMQYAKESHEAKGLKHSYVVGLADPTNAIPEGHIFVTGACDTAASQAKLFVTRCPCTEAADGHLLPLLQCKPSGMPMGDWEWLISLPFGGIIFGNPLPGNSPLPLKIANGDLDGDLYFICWSKTILSGLQTSSHTIMNAEEGKGVSNQAAWNNDWLRDGQDIMRDISATNNYHILIGKLHTLMEKTEDATDSQSFGQAYKEAIDIGKHGGQVSLPSHLWEKLPPQFHASLSPVEQ
jgi:hypothetical protein